MTLYSAFAMNTKKGAPAKKPVRLEKKRIRRRKDPRSENYINSLSVILQ
jgi:hypothetical protein